MKSLEHELQCACIQWFRAQYAFYKDCLFAIPNGGKRNLSTAARLKREGVLAGIPDLMLAIPVNGYSGFFIEMKAGKNKVTTEQERMIKILEQCGYKCAVIRSTQQFMDEVKKYMP